MNRALACMFCQSTLAQGAPLLEKNGAAICKPCVDQFSDRFAERAWAMATTLQEQLDVLLDESRRALEQSETLAERARSCGFSLHDLSASLPDRPLS
ncbi:ClpX C4-type zinc finger protein [Achromobacter seleniivolatilans]|uniref:ClpX C4-type zinc finger protein n=1 Tax=Achromobacter seleniivolatilans TaxID=3047478 RepID=A0ABY9LWZ7_9BURK|nr:MSHA biogenesis protein MshH [Achromobacter sp. R39]WMD18508.1 ClpX C4-type zinc finger protein [Achromobacter sp. R39]